MTKLQDRTFAIIASKDIRCDDIDLKVGEQIACITSAVPVASLLALIKFHGFFVEEVTAQAGDSDEADEEVVDDNLADTSEDDSDPEDTELYSDDEPAAEPASDEPVADVASSAVDEFIAAGLDEKIAKALADDNGLTPATLQQMIAEGKDLTELKSIGETRVKKILQVYPKP